MKFLGWGCRSERPRSCGARAEGGSSLRPDGAAPGLVMGEGVKGESDSRPGLGPRGRCSRPAGDRDGSAPRAGGIHSWSGNSCVTLGRSPAVSEPGLSKEGNQKSRARTPARPGLSPAARGGPDGLTVPRVHQMALRTQKLGGLCRCPPGGMAAAGAGSIARWREASSASGSRSIWPETHSWWH